MDVERQRFRPLRRVEVEAPGSGKARGEVIGGRHKQRIAVDHAVAEVEIRRRSRGDGSRRRKERVAGEELSARLHADVGTDGRRGADAVAVKDGVGHHHRAIDDRHARRGGGTVRRVVGKGAVLYQAGVRRAARKHKPTIGRADGFGGIYILVAYERAVANYRDCPNAGGSSDVHAATAAHVVVAVLAAESTVAQKIAARRIKRRFVAVYHTSLDAVGISACPRLDVTGHAVGSKRAVLGVEASIAVVYAAAIELAAQRYISGNNTVAGNIAVVEQMTAI